MRPKRKTGRRRCSECRHWYKPAPSTAKIQKTCGKSCRLKRRGRHEKARRQADLAGARRLEGERKRRHRERQAWPGRSMSRAGLSAEVAAAIEEIVDKLGHAERLSRAGLRRQIRHLFAGTLEKSEAEVGT